VLTSRVRVLSVALKGIDEYVALEAGRPGRLSSTEAMQRGVGTPLECVLQGLLSLHGRICTCLFLFPYHLTPTSLSFFYLTY
jgi:hypothetical protein